VKQKKERLKIMQKKFGEFLLDKEVKDDLRNCPLACAREKVREIQ
jgi:hypothetical protein